MPAGRSTPDGDNTAPDRRRSIEELDFRGPADTVAIQQIGAAIVVEVADADDLPTRPDEWAVGDHAAADFGRAIQQHDLDQPVGRPLEHQVVVVVTQEIPGADDFP